VCVAARALVYVVRLMPVGMIMFYPRSLESRVHYLVGGSLAVHGLEIRGSKDANA
jgi:hypothetical protein